MRILFLRHNNIHNESTINFVDRVYHTVYNRLNSITSRARFGYQKCVLFHIGSASGGDSASVSLR